jgi:hypothetical protein
MTGIQTKSDVLILKMKIFQLPIFKPCRISQFVITSISI